MDRRTFLSAVTRSAMVLLTLPVIAHDFEESDGACELSKDLATGMKTFAFYQALQPAQRRSPSRTDGTNYKMPCITQADIDAGEERRYEFWHGHGAATHRFTITAEDFARLQRGEAIEIYTDVVEGHRHALKIDPTQSC